MDFVFLFVTMSLYLMGIEWGNRLKPKHSGDLVKLFPASGKEKSQFNSK